jgi:hypothetical protein
MLGFIAEWVSVGQEAIITRESSPENIGVVGESARVLFLGLKYPDFFLVIGVFYLGGEPA